MLKNVLNLSEVKVLSKESQKTLKGGFDPRTPCHIAPPCDPDQISYQCGCYYPWEI